MYLSKPSPLVERSLIRVVHERIDVEGNADLVPLTLRHVRFEDVTLTVEPGGARVRLERLNGNMSLARTRPNGPVDVELDDVAFVVRLRRNPELRVAVEGWLIGATVPAESRAATGCGAAPSVRGRYPAGRRFASSGSRCRMYCRVS